MATPIIDTRFAQRRWNVTLKIGRAIKYIVVHYTGTDASALNNVKYFSGGNRNASADFFIDKDGSTYQFNAEIKNYYSWHCGDGKGKYGITNANSIGIEVVSSGAEFTDAQKKALRELVTWLMGKYGIAASNVVRHYDASRKTCPAPYAGSSAKDAKWRELHAYVTGGTATAPESKPEPAPVAKTGIDIDGLWGKDTTSALQKALGTTVDGIVSNQYASYRAKNPGLLASSWEWESKPGKNGSEMVKALQRKLGTTVDGYIGPNTIKALQRHLGTPVDGCASKPSAMVKELQCRLNAGTF